MRSHLPVIVLFGASILWGLTWLPLKHISAFGIDGVTLTFLVYGLLALALTPLLLRQFPTWRMHPKAMLLILLLGGGANLAFTYALVNGEVIRVMVLFYLLPVWGVLGGKFFLKEEIDRWRWLGASLAVFGAFFILGGFEALDAPPSWIDLIALLSGLFFAMNNLVFRAAQAVVNFSHNPGGYSAKLDDGLTQLAGQGQYAHFPSHTATLAAWRKFSISANGACRPAQRKCVEAA